MWQAFNNMSKFRHIADSLSSERLIGLVDGMQENTSKGRFCSLIEPVILWEMRDVLKNKFSRQVENINLTNYFGAYVNGYLFTANPVRRILDIAGREKTKYSCAMEHLEIPFNKNGKRFRTKDNLYNVLDERELLVYDDRKGCYDNGNRKNFEPRFRLEVED